MRHPSLRGHRTGGVWRAHASVIAHGLRSEPSLRSGARTIHAQRTQRERVAHACLLAMHELDVLGDKSGLNDTQKIALRTAQKHVGDQVCER